MRTSKLGKAIVQLIDELVWYISRWACVEKLAAALPVLLPGCLISHFPQVP